MSRLIDADEYERRCLFSKDVYENVDEDALYYMLEELSKTPTVDAERHGHWILTNKPNIYGGTSIKCSECGYEGVIAHIEDHHYCWVCGAKMDEVEEQCGSD